VKDHILLECKLVLIKEGKKNKGETYKECWTSLNAKIEQFITQAFETYQQNE
jgi:hypothetical protein